MSGAAAAVIASLYAASGGGGGGLLYADSDGNFESEQTTVTVSLTPGADANRYLASATLITDFLGGVENGATFNGVAMNQVGVENSYGYGFFLRTSLFDLVAPAAGPANLVASGTTGPPFVFIVGGAAYSGVDQGTPRGTVYTNSGTLGGASATIGATVSDALTGDTILAFVFCKDAAAGTPTLSAFNNSGAPIAGAVSTATESMTMVEFTAGGDAPTVSMTLSTSNPDQVDWEIRAFKLNPA